MTHKPARSFRLAKRQVELLEREAARLDISASELLRRIIDEFFARKGEK